MSFFEKRQRRKVIMLLFVLQLFAQIIIQWRWNEISSGLDSLECGLLRRFEVIRRPFSPRHLECEWQRANRG